MPTSLSNEIQDKNFKELKRSIKELYFNWLASDLNSWRTDKDGTHHDFLLRALNRKEFYWVLDRDENRASDGYVLRERFWNELTQSIGWESPPTMHDIGFDYPCTVLEMLIALANRIENDILKDTAKSDRTPEWFWMMIQNLGIDFADEDHENVSLFKVYLACDKMMSRLYDQNGVGGLFPLDEPQCDQTQVELWYQANSYISEKKLA